MTMHGEADFGKGVRTVMKTLHIIEYTLLWIGGLNWGLIGLFGDNLVDAILGSWPALVSLVYILVGLSALHIIFTHKVDCKVCGKM